MDLRLERSIDRIAATLAAPKLLAVNTTEKNALAAQKLESQLLFFAEQNMGYFKPIKFITALRAMIISDTQ